MELEIKALGWHWDRAKNILWGSATLTNGQSISVGLPVAHVSMTFDESVGELGLEVEAPSVGEEESVDGLFGRIGRAFSKATAGIRRTLQKAVDNTVGKVAQTVGKVALSVARSKLVGSALGGAAALFPAIGGPALGVWALANKAAKVHDTAIEAAKRVKGGLRTASDLARIKQGRALQARVRTLSRSTAPLARLGVAALRSI